MWRFRRSSPARLPVASALVRAFAWRAIWLIAWLAMAGAPVSAQVSRALKGHSLAFSPDSRIIASGSNDSSVCFPLAAATSRGARGSPCWR
jgi:hypothetical protein